MPLLPLLIGVIPSLIHAAENVLAPSANSSEKKEWVKDILGAIYDRVLKDKLPDFPGVDERAVFIDVCDYILEKTILKNES